MKIENNTLEQPTIFNAVKRWTLSGNLKLEKVCEMRDLKKGDYFIRLSKPNQLCEVTFFSKPYIKYFEWPSYKEEATTFTTEKVKKMYFVTGD